MSEYIADTLLQKQDIQSRMRCSGAIAARIEDIFTTVERLVEAVESDRELTSYEGIGPTTALVIEEWWSNRYKRERQVDKCTVEWTSDKAATIKFHHSWAVAITEEPGDEIELTEANR